MATPFVKDFFLGCLLLLNVISATGRDYRNMASFTQRHLLLYYESDQRRINTMGQPFTQVDAFTNIPFGGNPAAVCILSEPRNVQWMQQVAQEMNLAETAFLHQQEDGFQLRWFTPAVEVDLCGHATLASAHVLWEEGHLKPEEQARFYTRSGLLTAERVGDWIEMDFPATPAADADAPDDLARG